ncbi:hypothetical protein Pint_14658 [Pistacia integerrima]|uniref:Uncharacterized protein n=1 Tax=Pistacia integerrima TaxID=434235 RepID=A0ACC0Y8W9_9ROSI|nr:hypothetical protein Pint_14658 [Pistacia integerrima]
MNNISRALPISSEAKVHQLQLFYQSGMDKMQQANPYWATNEPELILTAGVRYIPIHETVSYSIESMKRNLDWVHVVAYDYLLPKGFPANKLVLGVPYHGYAWSLANPNDKAIGAPASGPAVTIDVSIGYKIIRALIQNYVFTSGATWINFDGVEKIRAKIAYAKEKKLLGYNAFQLSNDDNWALSMAGE